MRSRGQVRFITLTARLQKRVAAGIVLAVIAWGVTMAAMGWAQYRAQADRFSLFDREARVAAAEERVDAYGNEIEATTRDLERRQRFIEDMVDTLPSDAKAGETVSDSASENAEMVRKVSAAFPQAAGLARIEARQVAFVERLTRFADRRARRAASKIRQLGLDPDAMLRGTRREAMGGPLQRLATGPGGAVDPRFERLGLSLARMTALESGLEAMPQVVPASIAAISSGFGYRRDPFNGGGAMHSGLDFKGRIGAPIHAAAPGTVSFVGRKGGYGKTVEIDHGSGLMTRYAHMSRFGVARGTRVEAGAVIGGIGSTGRSTGPHLHFEVRMNGRAVNPRPFLEGS